MLPIDTNALFTEAVEHQRSGRLTEALRLYDVVVELDPESAAAHCNRGAALRDLGHPEKALESLNRAIQLRPDHAEAYNDQAQVLHCLDQPVKALESFGRAIELRPDFIDAYMNMADVMQDRGRADLALEICDRAIEVKPESAEAHSKRGDALRRLSRMDEAIQSYDRAIDFDPGFAKAYNNRGIALQQLTRLEEALESYDAAIALKTDYAKAYNNRGCALRELGQWEEALESFDKAIAINAEFAEAYFNGGAWQLQQGNFKEGWPLCEWRKKQVEPRGLLVCPQPDWTGKEDLEGKTVFVHAEQGFGDTIQFCRYGLLVREKGGRVVFGVQDGLIRLLKSLGPGIELVPLKGEPHVFDYHVALMSLPLAFGTTLGSCPAMVPYLHAEPEKVVKWRERIGRDGFKIGICWQGNKQAEIDTGRSFPVRHFEGITRLPNVRLISLQKNAGVEQLWDLPPGMSVETLGEEFDAGPDAFIDTAAVMECLDLVITPDTAVAHLAGALGRPAWVALKYVPDWRWLIDRSDSPWYPTLRLFRQPEPGDWASVFAKIQTELTYSWPVK
jgi:tetratricopeptide (TPR) repeat protein